MYLFEDILHPSHETVVGREELKGGHVTAVGREVVETFLHLGLNEAKFTLRFLQQPKLVLFGVGFVVR